MSTKHTISMKDAALAFTLRKTVSDRVAAEVKTERTALEDRILTRMKEEGVKQTIVTLPDGTPVATLTVTQPTRRTEKERPSRSVSTVNVMGCSASPGRMK